MLAMASSTLQPRLWRVPHGVRLMAMAKLASPCQRHRQSEHSEEARHTGYGSQYQYR